MICRSNTPKYFAGRSPRMAAMRMLAWLPLLIAAVGSLVLAGCRSDSKRELVERELRLQEDEIYHLQDELNERQAQLDSARRENGVLKQELGIPGPEAPIPIPKTRAAPGSPGIPNLKPPGVELPDSSLPDRLPPAPLPTRGSGTGRNGTGPGNAPKFEPPMIELPGFEGPAPGSPGSTGDAPAGGNRSSRGTKRGVRPASVQIDIDANPTTDLEPAGGQDRAAGRARVEKIVLNRRLTGGHNVDRVAGDEGVMVVFAPCDADDNLVQLPGEVSIVLVDPAISGAAGRVARWNFAPDEAMQYFKKTPFGEGFHLDVRWPNQPPQNERLMLFVRFTTWDGTKLEAGQAITIGRNPDIRPAKSIEGRATDNRAKENRVPYDRAENNRAVKNRVTDRHAAGNTLDTGDPGAATQRLDTPLRSAPTDVPSVMVRTATAIEPASSQSSRVRETQPSERVPLSTARNRARPNWTPER